MATEGSAALTPAELAVLRGRLTALATPGADSAALADAAGEAVAAILAARAPRPAGAPRPGLAHETDPARRIVITGMGAMTALGLSVEAFWDGLIGGRSGGVPIAGVDTSAYPSRIAAQIRDFDPAVWIDRKEARRMSRATQLIVSAARQALQDSGLAIPEDGADQIGVFIGSGTTALPETEETMRSIVKGG